MILFYERTMNNRIEKNYPIEKTILKLTTKAVLERNLIEENDRILIGASGGKDSTLMAYALEMIRPAVKKNYELLALHISNDFSNDCDKAILSQRMTDWNIPFKELYVPVVERLKEGEKMSCYWCSTMRRTELIKYALEHGFNKIALGHHLDDIIETFFMNMMNKGQLSTMPIKLAYKKYPLTLIRPLAYIEERQIIDCANVMNILQSTCTCSYGENSKRKTTRQKIAQLTDNSSNTKRRILQSLSTEFKDLLMEP